MAIDWCITKLTQACQVAYLVRSHQCLLLDEDLKKKQIKNGF